MKTFLALTALCAVLLFSCQHQDEAKTEYGAAADTTSIYGLSGEAVKLVKTADLTAEVAHVGASVKAVSRLAHELGGMVTHQELITTIDDRKELRQSPDSVLRLTALSTRSTLTVRVPAAQLETFLFAVSDGASFVVHSGLNIDDKSGDYLATAQKIAARQAVLAGLHPAKVKEIDDLVAAKDDAIDKATANRQTDADARYSTVQLELAQPSAVRREVLANTDLGVYELPIGQQFRQALATGWNYFLRFWLLLAPLWVFLLMGLGGWMAYRRYGMRGKLPMAKG